MIDDTLDEIPKKQQFLRETVPFGLVYQIDKRVRTEMPFKKFKDRVIDGYKAILLRGELESLEVPADKLPSDEVLHHLHHLAIEARIDREWWREAQAIAKTPSWKDHMKLREDVITFTEKAMPVLSTVDIYLSPRDTRILKLSQRVLQRLRDRFRENLRWDQRLKDVEEHRIWNSRLRQARHKMDHVLEEHCKTLNKAQRMELIALTVTASGLKQEETLDAIARQLSPDRAGRKLGQRTQSTSRPLEQSKKS
jgi:hypothetical protein